MIEEIHFWIGYRAIRGSRPFYYGQKIAQKGKYLWLRSFELNFNSYFCMEFNSTLYIVPVTVTHMHIIITSMFCFAALDLVSRSDLHAMFHQDQLCVTRMFFVYHEKKLLTAHSTYGWLSSNANKWNANANAKHIATNFSNWTIRLSVSRVDFASISSTTHNIFVKVFSFAFGNA